MAIAFCDSDVHKLAFSCLCSRVQLRFVFRY